MPTRPKRKNATADRALKQALDHYQWRDVIAALGDNANPDTLSADKTAALTRACWYLELDAVRALLEHGANPNITKGAPLIATISTTSGDARDVLRLLLAHGAKTDVRGGPNQNGASALAIAIDTGHPVLAEILIQAGADVSVRGNDRKNALKVAKESGFARLVELMGKKPAPGKAPAIDPFIDATYHGMIAKGKTAAPHISGVVDWQSVFADKHFAGCGNPPVHLLTLDLALIPEFPRAVRRLGKVPIVSHACDCDEWDVYRFRLGKNGKLASYDDDDDARNECARRDYRPSTRPTGIKLERCDKPSDCGIEVGGQPRWAQSPWWPVCPKCKNASFFIARLYQYYLPPSARGAGNTLNVFVCADCRTQSMVRQST